MSVYVHVPFCRSICDFCGFEKRLYDRNLIEVFASRAIEQLQSHLNKDIFRPRALRSVYFGGGTASLLPVGRLLEILTLIKSAPIWSDCEVTLECEPGTINLEMLRLCRDYGVNRISIGAQSTSKRDLKALGRKHSVEHIFELAENALRAGFSNIHVDLIYGIQGQSLEEWIRSLTEIAALPIKHISAYKLYVFQGGALDRAFPQLLYPTSKQLADLRLMHDLAQQVLSEQGFSQYSLTEYARKGFQSQYIRNFFDSDGILGIGPGAFSKNNRALWEIQGFVRHYCNNDIKTAAHLTSSYLISDLEAFKRDVILGLWLLSVNLPEIARLKQITISDDLWTEFSNLIGDGLLDRDGGTILVGPHQRFEIGKAMSRLANLEVSKWGESQWS